MNRAEMLNRVRVREKIWDFVVIGGGATGAGCAIDAASRGFDVLLLEQNDFGKGTSSRSTKLIHGGVRYLAQGDISLVREALKERGFLLKNAPRFVKKQPFIVPVYSLWEKFFYGAGLKIYDFLSGKYSFGKSIILSKKEMLKRLPNINRKNLRGGIVYFDGQFDDSRLLINLVRTAAGRNAAVLNYAKVFCLTKNQSGKIDGVQFRDTLINEEFNVRAQVVINATGAFCDSIRRLSVETRENIISPSQGIHLVFDKEFLPSDDALMIPKTADGRVLFAIPWHDKVLIGTTDTPVEKAELEPDAMEEEIEFILETARKYLVKAPRRENVLSVFVGIRPLVKSSSAKNTASLSRDHTIEIDASNLLTITGGKWTTYRKMAEDAVDQAIKLTDLPENECMTENLKIYDADREERQKLAFANPTLTEKLHADLPYCAADVIYAVKNEMAQTIEDVLARRTRALFLNARAAIEIAPFVAQIAAKELEKDENWIQTQVSEFNELAKKYVV